MEEINTFAQIVPVLFIGLGVVTGLLAQRKGYNFFAWLLAAGCIGLVVLAFLPFANNPGLEAEKQAELKKTGNIVGGALTAVGILLAVLRYLPKA